MACVSTASNVGLRDVRFVRTGGPGRERGAGSGARRGRSCAASHSATGATARAHVGAGRCQRASLWRSRPGHLGRAIQGCDLQSGAKLSSTRRQPFGEQTAQACVKAVIASPESLVPHSPSSLAGSEQKRLESIQTSFSPRQHWTVRTRRQRRQFNYALLTAIRVNSHSCSR